MKLIHFPLTKVTIGFVFGILFAFYWQPNLIALFVFVGVSILFFALSYYLSSKTFDQTPIFAASLYLIFFALGILTTSSNNKTFRSNHYTQSENYFENSKSFQLLIREKLKNSTKYERYFAEVLSIESKATCGKIVLNIKKDSTENYIKIGNQLFVHGNLLHQFPANNPNQFDYGKYLETKGVHGQIYTEPSAIKKSTTTTKDIWFYTANFRNTIITNLAKSGFKKEELAVVTALLLGQQQDISPEILRDYQYAGAVHILSVSGLHVGFILLFITFILKPIPATRLGNWSRLLILIVSLWLFAFVAGLAPSVVRSTVMFSFIAVGMHLRRETNTFHTTLVSLFLILLFEPMFLFDIGFQLSYLAVFFILWLQPIFNNLWLSKNVVLKYFWDILTVSFAAQIGTLPLTIYYFHQFPGLFFVTNLVLIPFLSIIMALGTLLMLLAYFDWFPYFLSKTVEILITVTNTIINKIASLESFVLKEIPLSFSMMLLAYLILISWIIWFQKPKFYKLIIALIGLLLFQSLFLFSQWKLANNQEFIVFNTIKKTIIGNRTSVKLSLFSSEEIVKNSFEHNMTTTYATAHFTKVKEFKPIENTFYFNRKKILVVDSSSIYKTSICPDILVLSHSPKINLDRLLETQQPEIIIADASNYKSYISTWKRTCMKKKIPFHSTYEKGFYSLKN